MISWIHSHLPKRSLLFLAAIFIAVCGYQIGNALQIPESKTRHATHKLVDLWPQPTATYRSFYSSNGSTVHVVDANLNSGHWTLVPALNQPTDRTSRCANKHQASAAVNGGYFNGGDGSSIGYVIVDGKVLSNPRENKSITRDRRLRRYLEAIFNRSEVRILQDAGGKESVQIAAHNDPIPPQLKLLHSLQAGPRLLPEITSQQEAFVRSDGSDGIRTRDHAARTAFGITANGHVLIVTVAGPGQDGSPGVTLVGMANLMKELGCTEAINFDGGSSTTMFVRLPQPGTKDTVPVPAGTVVCGRHPETWVASVFMLVHVDR